MSTDVRHLFLVLLAVLLTGCAGVDADTTLIKRTDALLAPLVAANEFSGAVVLSRHGRVVYQRGFGLANQAAILPFTVDTPSDGASLAKTFTAAAVMLLVQEGRIALDAPVTRYVPEYPHAQTTVRQLLSHSNGLPPQYEFFDPHFGPDEVRTTSAMLRTLARERTAPLFAPGSRFEYSNLGYDAAARVVEQVSGQTYEAFVRQRFFAPLGFQHSFARPARFADWQGVRTLGYRWRAGAWQVVDVFDREAFLGASNLYLSATDLARWAGAHATGRALPAQVVAAGLQPNLIDGRPSHINLLSWYCDDGRLRCYYTGSLNAFHGFAYWDRERGESVAFVSNSALPPWRTITLQRALVDALQGRPALTEEPPRFERFTRQTRPTVAGRYDAAGLGTLTLSSGAAGLQIRIGDGLAFDVFPVSADVFYVPGPDHWLAFSGGAQPTTLHLRSMFVDTVAQRVRHGRR